MTNPANAAATIPGLTDASGSFAGLFNQNAANNPLLQLLGLSPTSTLGQTLNQAGTVNINPISPPPMKTLVYSPDVRILIAHDAVQYDVSRDIVGWSIRRAENSVASLVFRLANKAGSGTANNKLRYNQLFERMDRVIVMAKRVEWVQIFSGYLDSVPHVQLYPGTVNFRASCTLKRLIHTWWDPGLPAAQGIFNQAGDEVDTAIGTKQPDSGIGTMLQRLLVEVGGWSVTDVHVQKFPSGYYYFMQQQLQKLAGTDADAKSFERLLLGSDTTLGTGYTAGAQPGVTTAAYTAPGDIPSRKLQVLQAVDQMGMGVQNTDLGLGQGIGSAATGGKDNKDQAAWQANTELGKNYAQAAMQNDAAVHAFMAIYAESGWVMFANNADPDSLTFPHEAISPDHDSEGLYQQRMTWGTTGQRMNTFASTQMFLQKLQQQDWRNSPRAQAVQNVQQSANATGSQYAGFEQTALAEVEALRQGVSGQGQSSQGNVAGLGAPVSSGAALSTATGGILTGSTGIPTTGGTPDIAGAASIVGAPKFDTAGALSYATSKLGCPYHWGDTGPATFDCIAEGTLVTTARGDIPIEDVTVADRVLTRRGFRNVTRAVKVRDDAEIVGVIVNGKLLEGTSDHRVWTENRGWVPLAEVATYDTLVSCLPVTRTSLARPSSFRGSRISGIQNHPVPAIGTTFSDQVKRSTEPSGNTITADQFLKVTRSTTWIMTPSTTIPAISCASRCLTIDAKARRAVGYMTTSALSAERAFRPTVYHSASRGSVLVSTSKSSTTISARPRRSVYDLSVEGEHEFFANGVLVHNCSGLTMMAYRSIGIDIGRNTTAQKGTGVQITAAQAVPGDLIFPVEYDHVVMYVGGNSIIEAPTEGQNVKYNTIYFNPSTAMWRHYPPAEYGGSPVAPFNPMPTSPGNAPGTVAQGAAGGTVATGSNEPIARNLFTYQFAPGQFANAVSSLFGGQPGTEEKAFINDEPLIQTVQAMAAAGLRNFQSAPDGSITFYYPDYFGLDGKNAVLSLEDIECKNVQIDLNDDALATHVYVAGSPNPRGASMGVLGWLMSKGVATVENEWLFRRMQLAAPVVRGQDLITNGTEFMRKFGVRPLTRDMSAIQSGPMEFLMALQLFMTKWAEQYATTIELTFMPELFPGMRLNLVGHALQVYVTEVTHSGDFESGFTTSAVIMAPSNTLISKLGQTVANMTMPSSGTGSTSGSASSADTGLTDLLNTTTQWFFGNGI